jgi:hypothetical protein
MAHEKYRVCGKRAKLGISARDDDLEEFLGEFRRPPPDAIHEKSGP